jgi:hypothetical protein
MVRLRHASQIDGREASEIILLNSHDGTSGERRRQPTVFPRGCTEGMRFWICCHYRIQATTGGAISN